MTYLGKYSSIYMVYNYIIDKGIIEYKIPLSQLVNINLEFMKN